MVLGHPPPKGYSIDFFIDCFPSYYYACMSSENCQSIINFLFPPETKVNCATPTSGGLRWQNLVVPCALGFTIGVYGYLSGERSNVKNYRHFRLACFYFGLMNAVAFLTHCVFTPHSIPWDIMYTLDMVFTSTSSLNLIFWSEVRGSKSRKMSPVTMSQSSDLRS